MAFQTVSTFSTCDMSFSRYQISNLKSPYTFPFFYNLSNVLMACSKANRNGMLRPVIPLINVYIRSTDCCLMNLDLHIIRSHFRDRNSLHPETFFRFFFYQCPHQTIIIQLHIITSQNTPSPQMAFILTMVIITLLTLIDNLQSHIFCLF